MDGFLTWFYEFITTMLLGVWRIFSNIFGGIIDIFNFAVYFDQIQQNKNAFGAFDWVLTIIALIITFAIWILIIFMLVLLVRRYFRHRGTLVGSEDLLEEISDLHRDILRLTKDKERIMNLKVSQTGMSLDDINRMFADDAHTQEEPIQEGLDTAAVSDTPHEDITGDVTGAGGVVTDAQRFIRLSAVDEKYEFFTPPEYNRKMSLSEICEDIRNFSCSKMKLYYNIKIIRLIIAGLASTKLILLQGISGTGKTSLPYMMGKYFNNDATIASVQPSWRDRTELFGYFNEFTKKFNETEVLRRIYEATYNDDLNIIVLDELNIARVEYYFAEMLSILEMPNPSEWRIELVPSSWTTDPRHLPEGKLRIPQNVWYIGTANNDDSTFAVSDKVYDRAFVINLDAKGEAFKAPLTEPKFISYSYVDSLYDKAIAEHPVSKKNVENINMLDIYVIEKFRIAFGNRILKQLHMFVPVYVACGGSEVEGIDYLLATKVLRKFESLNLSLIRDEIPGLIAFLDNRFGKGNMKECIEYLERLQRMY